MMKMQGNWLTKGAALLFLGALAALGVWIASLFIPAPYHYVGVVFPFAVLYLLGTLASRNSAK